MLNEVNLLTSYTNPKYFYPPTAGEVIYKKQFDLVNDLELP